MKQNIFMAALLAAMLALAGCGGGSSSSSENNITPPPPGGGGGPVTKEAISMKIEDCGDADCVDAAIQEAKDGGISGDELAALEAEAETKKDGFAPAGATALAGLEKTQADELLDALQGGEALDPEVDSDIFNTRTGELENADESWKDGPSGTGPNIGGGWTGNSHHIPNPAGSSGRIQDIRYWTENPKWLSQSWNEFFTSGRGSTESNNFIVNRGFSAVSGQVTLPDIGADDPFNRNSVPSTFYTSGWKYNPAFVDPESATDNIISGGVWEFKGDYLEVRGSFFVPINSLQVTVNGQSVPFDSGNPEHVKTLSDPIGNRDDFTGVKFVPAQASEAAEVDAKWAQLTNPNFLSFGVYWNTDVDDTGKVDAISVDPFAGGGTEYSATGNVVISGDGVLTAKYSGGAAGLYVRTMIDDNDDRVATGFGEFTADANFTAKFAVGKDTLSGTIGNFKKVTGTGAGDDPDSAWEVTLSDEITDGSAGSDAEGFHAQFYGQVTPTDGRSARQSNGHAWAPYGLVGTFQSGNQLDNGQVSGAFGAECDGVNCVKQD